MQRVGASCSYLNYRLPYPRISGKYELTLYAEDPCNSEGIILLNLSVNVYVHSCSCAHGLMPDNSSTNL